ncbi:MAG: YIP1 family protein, partial [Candidatus Hodarchaeales archaeon]
NTTIELSDNFSDPLLSSTGISPEMYIQILSSYIIPFSTVITFFIFWLVSGLVLWIIQSLISSNIPAHRRNFKVQLTIAGWTYLPLIFYGLIEVLIVTLFVEPSTFIVNELLDIALIGIPMESTIGLVITVIGIFFLIWRVAIVYFAVRVLDPEGSHATIITVVYAVFIFLFT